MRKLLHNKRLFLCRFLRRGVNIRAPPQVNLKIKSNLTSEDKMVKIYIKDANGRKIFVEVTEEQARVYREELKSEWRSMANAKNNTVSLDGFIDAGHDIADENADIESVIEEKEKKQRTKILIQKLKGELPLLTLSQRKTIYKMFVLNKTQSQIAKEEGVTRWAVKNRVDGIYKKLKKILEEN